MMLTRDFYKIKADGNTYKSIYDLIGQIEYLEDHWEFYRHYHKDNKWLIVLWMQAANDHHKSFL